LMGFMRTSCSFSTPLGIGNQTKNAPLKSARTGHTAMAAGVTDPLWEVIW
jgi:hypothetical protein